MWCVLRQAASCLCVLVCPSLCLWAISVMIFLLGCVCVFYVYLQVHECECVTVIPSLCWVIVPAWPDFFMSVLLPPQRPAGAQPPPKLSVGRCPATTCPDMCLQPGISPTPLTTHTLTKHTSAPRLHRPSRHPLSLLNRRNFQLARATTPSRGWSREGPAPFWGT